MTHKSKAGSTAKASFDDDSDVPETANGIHRRIDVKIETEPVQHERKGSKFGPMEVELPSPRSEGRPKRSRYEQIERGQGGA